MWTRSRISRISRISSSIRVSLQTAAPGRWHRWSPQSNKARWPWTALPRCQAQGLATSMASSPAVCSARHPVKSVAAQPRVQADLPATPTSATTFGHPKLPIGKGPTGSVAAGLMDHRWSPTAHWFWWWNRWTQPPELLAALAAAAAMATSQQLQCHQWPPEVEATMTQAEHRQVPVRAAPARKSWQSRGPNSKSPAAHHSLAYWYFSAWDVRQPFGAFDSKAFLDSTRKS